MPITIPTMDAPRLSEGAAPTPYNNNAPAPSAWSLGAQAAGDGANLLKKAKDEADQQSVLEAHNALRAFTDDGLAQVRQAQGKNAAIVAQQVQDASKKKARDLFGALTNDDQKRAFSNLANQELEQTHKIGEVHVGQQILVARQEEFNGANALSVKRVTDNANVPGVAETEADQVRRRIYGYTDENGVKVPGQASAMGLPPEAAKSLEAQQVGLIYGAQARTLLGQGDIRGAAAVIAAHADELGEASAELRGKVEMMARNARADDAAKDLAVQFGQTNGTVDIAKALAAVDTKYAAGPERNAVREALMHRADEASQAKHTLDTQHWESLLSDYQGNGRSYWAVQTLKSWADSTPEQREMLRSRWIADQHEAAGMPLTKGQMEALGRLQNDLIDRKTYWGTADASELQGNRDFNMLPEGVQKGLVGEAAQLRQDRTDPAALLRSTQETLRLRAQENGILGRTTRGEPYEKWHQEDKDAWARLQDLVAPRITAWHMDPANRGKRIPNEVVEGYVDDAFRKGTTSGGVFRFLSSTTQDKAAARTPAEQAAHPFVPTPTDYENDVGKKVLYRQGYKPEEMTPEKILGAARAYREVQAGPGPQERNAIIEKLRAAGAANPKDDAIIRQIYERAHLKYAPGR